MNENSNKAILNSDFFKFTNYFNAQITLQVLFNYCTESQKKIMKS